MALVYASLGQIYRAMAKTDEALRKYQLGLGIAQGYKLKFVELSLNQGLGDVYSDRKEDRQALRHFEKTLALAREQERSEYISTAARRMGDTYRRMGNTPQAMASYKVAIEQIESIRSLLASGRDRESYFAGGLAAYAALIETLWVERRYADAFHYGERIRSRSFLDTLGTKLRLSRDDSAGVANKGISLAEFDESKEGERSYRKFVKEVSRTNPEQASLMSVQPVGLRDLQKLLRPEQLLLQYLVTNERTYFWAIDQTRLRAYTIPLARKDLFLKIDTLRNAISNVGPIDDYQSIAQDLYEQLIRPAAQAMVGKELIVVPHDVLHYLPFHALYSPKNKYLIEDHAISYLSSASLLPFVERKGRKISNKILSIGNPRIKGNQGDLPLAELEASEVKNHFPIAAVLLREDASEAKIKTLAASYDILHFAGHAELREKDPLASAMLLTSGSDEDGRLEVREIFGMKLTANLVVLSGCETGLGTLSTGDELVGLTRAFIYAGTPSIVASLWRVDDASTAHLMSGFYGNLKSKSKVEALRQAQLRLIRGDLSSDLLARRGIGGAAKLGEAPAAKGSASIATSHPYFWAPFILVGDGR